MSAPQHEHSSHPGAPSSVDAGRTGMPAGAAVFLGVFGFAIMALTLFVKYLVTGTTVRDGFGWVLLSLSLVLGVAMPTALWLRGRSKKAGGSG